MDTIFKTSDLLVDVFIVYRKPLPPTKEKLEIVSQTLAKLGVAKKSLAGRG